MTNDQQLLGDKHAFVRLVDSMPENVPGAGDQRIVDAARNSIAGLDVRSTSDNEKLIAYLVKNKHSTPLEFVRFTFHVRLPLFVARQWVRHRMGCLPGDAEISFQRPVDGGHYPKSMADVARSFDDPAQRPRLKEMELRCCLPDGSVGTTRVSKVWSTGAQDVYAVHLRSGRVVRATLSHQFLCDDEKWRTLGEIHDRYICSPFKTVPALRSVSVQYPINSQEKHGFVGWVEMGEGPPDEEWKDVPGWSEMYQVSSLGRVRGLRNTRGKPLDRPRMKKQTRGNHGYPVVSLSRFGRSEAFLVHRLVAETFYGACPDGLEVRHLDGDRLDCRVTNLAYGTSEENSLDMVMHGRHGRLMAVRDEIVSIDYDGIETTWDMEVDGPHHNFIANGVVVHNSFNEESARYGKLRDDFYVPTLERVMTGGQSTSNKQGSGAPLSKEIAAEVIDRIARHNADSYMRYEAMLKCGLAKELARLVLPVNIYTQWFWSTDLHNLMHFLQLRLHEHAQWEVRQYAKAIEPMAEALAPFAMAAWRKYRMPSGPVGV